MVLRAKRERRVRVVLGRRDAESAKQRWLIVESFTALLNLDFMGDIQSAMTGSYFLFLITSSMSDPTLNHRKTPTIPSLEIMDFFSWPRFRVVLVVLICVGLSVWTAESEVTVGCAGARPVNPLKLGQTLSTLNF